MKIPRLSLFGSFKTRKLWNQIEKVNDNTITLTDPAQATNFFPQAYETTKLPDYPKIYKK